MARDDWLGGYGHPDGVRRALHGISGRLARANPLAAGFAELARDYRRLEREFHELLPEVRRFAAAQEFHELLPEVRRFAAAQGG
jgi:acyl carrier protein phosphodiesterase